MTVTENCEISYEPLTKAIELVKNPKAQYDHLMLEEIYESIDGVDKATDFGQSFVSSHQVSLPAFSRSK